ncbi:hypothetical protein DSUL_60306 [Desulfovibrionales bacterium]
MEEVGVLIWFGSIVVFGDSEFEEGPWQTYIGLKNQAVGRFDSY